MAHKDHLRKRKRSGHVVGFYKKDGKTRPVTKSMAQLKQRKLVKGKQFKGIKPSSISLSRKAYKLLPKKFIRYMKMKNEDLDLEVAEWAHDQPSSVQALIEEYHPDRDIRDFFKGMNQSAGIGSYEQELEHEQAVKGYAGILTKKAEAAVKKQLKTHVEHMEKISKGTGSYDKKGHWREKRRMG